MSFASAEHSPAADELVIVIRIEWSDQKMNTVRRTLNEVSILERDMRHGNYHELLTFYIALFSELLGMKKKDKVEEFQANFKIFKG